MTTTKFDKSYSRIGNNNVRVRSRKCILLASKENKKLVLHNVIQTSRVRKKLDFYLYF